MLEERKIFQRKTLDYNLLQFHAHDSKFVTVWKFIWDEMRENER